MTSTRERPQGRLHPDEAVTDGEVSAFHQLDPHLLREKRVLEVGGVVHARREQNDRRLGDVARPDVLEHLQELARVRVDRAHARGFEDARERALHHPPVLKDVRHARWTAEVVFEHVVATVAVANEVRAAHVAPDAVGGVKTPACGEIGRGGFHELARHDAVREDALRVVEVVEEEVERTGALFEAALEHLPLRGRDDPGNHVEREDFFDAVFVAVDVERAAHVEQRAFGRPLAPEHLSVGDGRERADDESATVARLAGRVEHFVVKRCGFVAFKLHEVSDRRPDLSTAKFRRSFLMGGDPR